MSQVDHFKNHATGLNDMVNRHFAIVPSDGEDMPVRPRAIYVATAGTVAIRDLDGVTLTYPVIAGQILPIRAVRIMATGTTATVFGWW